MCVCACVHVCELEGGREKGENVIQKMILGPFMYGPQETLFCSLWACVFVCNMVGLGVLYF